MLWLQVWTLVAALPRVYLFKGEYQMRQVGSSQFPTLSLAIFSSTLITSMVMFAFYFSRSTTRIFSNIYTFQKKKKKKDLQPFCIFRHSLCVKLTLVSFEWSGQNKEIIFIEYKHYREIVFIQFIVFLFHSEKILNHWSRSLRERDSEGEREWRRKWGKGDGGWDTRCIVAKGKKRGWFPWQRGQL